MRQNPNIYIQSTSLAWTVKAVTSYINSLVFNIKVKNMLVCSLWFLHTWQWKLLRQLLKLLRLLSTYNIKAGTNVLTQKKLTHSHLTQSHLWRLFTWTADNTVLLTREEESKAGSEESEEKNWSQTRRGVTLVSSTVFTERDDATCLLALHRGADVELVIPGHRATSHYNLLVSIWKSNLLK